MQRFLGIAALGFAAWTSACSSSSSGGAGPSDGEPTLDTGNAGDGGDGGAIDGGVDGTNPGYTGGDVTVSLTAGADGGVVDPSAVSGSVTIHMAAATPSAISKIEALVDGAVVGTATSAPFDVPFDSTTVTNGSHSVSARPYDLGGKSGTSAPLAITTSNFLLGGAWKWTGITDGSPGFPTDHCSDTSFTVTFDAKTSTMTLPMFFLSCTTSSGASYSAKIDGFSQTVKPADFGGPISNTTGTVTTTFSTTSMTQTDSFNGSKQTGKLSR